MIEIDAVTRSFTKKGGASVKAVDGLTLTVQPGEIFGFLGPNGAGKSTTIRMMIGLLKPDSGTIRMQHIPVVERALEVKRIIGYVPDEALFYERMSGLQYLEFIADIYSMSKEVRKRRIMDLAEEFMLDDALQEIISSYSHGMRQKLAIIAALLHDPEIFILDEPMVGLDPKAAFILKEKMRELCRRGKTVFFSTHVMDVAERLCDRVGIIRKGSLIACAPFETLRSQTGEQGATLENIFLEMTDEPDTHSL